MLPRVVHHVLVGDPRVGVVLHRTRCGIHERLNGHLITVGSDVPPQETAGGSVYGGQQVRPFFLSPTNV